MKLEFINEALVTEANWYKKKKYSDINDLINDFVKDNANELDRWFISFTSLDKLGINPGSTYKTPLGIYSYPLYYAASIGNIERLPFANESRFINLFKIKNNATILKDSDAGSEYMAKLNKHMPGIFDHYKDDVERHGTRSNIGQFWLYTKLAVKSDPKKWAHLLRRLGIDGIVDDGTGTIHPVYPTEAIAVFFSAGVIDKNIRFEKFK